MRKRVDKKRRATEEICRWCEHFVPRASMCVHAFSTDPGMSLRRRADETCDHFEPWRPFTPSLHELQTRDRLEAAPREKAV